MLSCTHEALGRESCNWDGEALLWYAQTEESKSVLQDDGEDPDGRKDKCTWEGDGKKATQRERRKWGWGKGKHERARTFAHSLGGMVRPAGVGMLAGDAPTAILLLGPGL